MARFTYIQETDSDGNTIGTTILETGGYFAGYTPAEIEAVAEEHFPKYSHGNMSETFWHVYFNHTLRKRLEELNGTPTPDGSTLTLPEHIQPGDGLRGSETQRPGSYSSGQPEDGDTAGTRD